MMISLKIRATISEKYRFLEITSWKYVVASTLAGYSVSGCVIDSIVQSNFNQIRIFWMIAAFLTLSAGWIYICVGIEM